MKLNQGDERLANNTLKRLWSDWHNGTQNSGESIPCSLVWTVIFFKCHYYYLKSWSYNLMESLSKSQWASYDMKIEEQVVLLRTSMNSRLEPNESLRRTNPEGPTAFQISRTLLSQNSIGCARKPVTSGRVQLCATSLWTVTSWTPYLYPLRLAQEHKSRAGVG